MTSAAPNPSLQAHCTTFNATMIMQAACMAHCAVSARATLQDLGTLTVRDMMTRDPVTIRPDTPVMDAMNSIVEHNISALPVVNESGAVLGMCSGYDLLALDCTPGKLDRSYFPPIDTCINEYGGDRKMMWSNFKELRKKLNVATSNTVREVRLRCALALEQAACCMNSQLILLLARQIACNRW